MVIKKLPIIETPTCILPMGDFKSYPSINHPTTGCTLNQEV